MDIITQYGGQLIKIGVYVIVFGGVIFYHIKQRHRINGLIILNFITFILYLIMIILDLDLLFFIAIILVGVSLNITRTGIKDVINQTIFGVKVFFRNLTTKTMDIKTEDKIKQTSQLAQFKAKLDKRFSKDVKKTIGLVVISRSLYVGTLLYYYFFI